MAAQSNRVEGQPSMPARVRRVNSLGTARSLAAMKVVFKLDPRLTRSLYMGDRWVSPATYTGLQRGTFMVEAKALGRNAQGQQVNASPEWIPADPGMVTVSPPQGNAVTISVHRAGQSRVNVVSGAVSRILSIKATQPSDSTLQVEISQ